MKCLVLQDKDVMAVLRMFCGCVLRVYQSQKMTNSAAIATEE